MELPGRNSEIIQLSNGVYSTRKTQKMDELAAPENCHLPLGINFIRFAGGNILDQLLAESRKQKKFVALSKEYIMWQHGKSHSHLRNVVDVIRKRYNDFLNVLPTIGVTKNEWDDMVTGMTEASKDSIRNVKEDTLEMMNSLIAMGYIEIDGGNEELVQLKDIKKNGGNDWIITGNF